MASTPVVDGLNRPPEARTPCLAQVDRQVADEAEEAEDEGGGESPAPGRHESPRGAGDERRMDFFKKSFTLSSRRAREVLGFAPRVSFVDGAAETARWYAQMGYL